MHLTVPLLISPREILRHYSGQSLNVSTSFPYELTDLMISQIKITFKDGYYGAPFNNEFAFALNIDNHGWVKKAEIRIEEGRRIDSVSLRKLLCAEIAVLSNGQNNVSRYNQLLDACQKGRDFLREEVKVIKPFHVNLMFDLLMKYRLKPQESELANWYFAMLMIENSNYEALLSILDEPIDLTWTGETFGGGTFGKVYGCHNPQVGRVAVKRIDLLQRPGAAKYFKMEIEAMKAVKGNRRFVQLLRAYTTGRYLELVMEVLDGCPGHKIVPLVDLSIMGALIRELLTSLHNLHSAGYRHDDFSSANFMLLKTGDIVLIDFGYAVPVNGPPETPGLAGFHAPEFYDPTLGFDATTDTWALATWMIYLYNINAVMQLPQLPLTTRFTKEFLRTLFQGQVETVISKIPGTDPLSASFKSFLRTIFTYNPRERLSIPQLLQHPFISHFAISQNIFKAWLARVVNEKPYEVNATWPTRQTVILREVGTSFNPRAAAQERASFQSPFPLVGAEEIRRAEELRRAEDLRRKQTGFMSWLNIAPLNKGGVRNYFNNSYQSERENAAYAQQAEAQARLEAEVQAHQQAQARQREEERARQQAQARQQAEAQALQIAVTQARQHAEVQARQREKEKALLLAEAQERSRQQEREKARLEAEARERDRQQRLEQERARQHHLGLKKADEGRYEQEQALKSRLGAEQHLVEGRRAAETEKIVLIVDEPEALSKTKSDEIKARQIEIERRIMEKAKEDQRLLEQLKQEEGKTSEDFLAQQREIEKQIEREKAMKEGRFDYKKGEGNQSWSQSEQPQQQPNRGTKRTRGKEESVPNKKPRGKVLVIDDDE